MPGMTRGQMMAGTLRQAGGQAPQQPQMSDMAMPSFGGSSGGFHPQQVTPLAAMGSSMTNTVGDPLPSLPGLPGQSPSPQFDTGQSASPLADFLRRLGIGQPPPDQDLNAPADPNESWT